jgi:hypothetical protein
MAPLIVAESSMKPSDASELGIDHGSVPQILGPPGGYRWGDNSLGKGDIQPQQVTAIEHIEYGFIS